MVYGSKDVFDVAAQYGWSRPLADRLEYCGYVCAPAPTQPVDTIRRRYLKRGDDSKLIVAMAGGGADGHRLFVTLRAVENALVPNSPRLGRAARIAVAYPWH